MYQVILKDYIIITIQADSWLDVVKELKESGLSFISITQL